MRFELTTTGATSRCSVQLSYGHTDHDRNRTCMSGFAGPHLAIRSRGRARRAGIEPAASRFGGGRSAIGTSGAQLTSQCVGRESNPHVSPKRGRGYGPLHCRSATYALSDNQRGRIRTFDLVRRGTRDAKLRHTLNLIHAPGGNRTHHSPVEGRASLPLDDGSG